MFLFYLRHFGKVSKNKLHLNEKEYIILNEKEYIIFFLSL